MSTNITLQYSITRSLSGTASYVFTQGQNLQTGLSTNNVSKILGANDTTSDQVPWPDFSHGLSYQTTIGGSDYNGLQTKLEQQFASGVSYLLAYTYSKTMGDAGDLTC
jgi:hypothetical protein